MLKPVNLESIIEDAHLAVSSLEYLTGRVLEFVPDNVPDHHREHFGHSLGVWPQNTDEYFRVHFDGNWDTFASCMKRLAVHLNDGDIDELDCDFSTREALKSLWGLLEHAQCEKPEYVPGGGRQELAVSNEWGEMTRQVISMLPGHSSYIERHTKDASDEGGVEYHVTLLQVAPLVHRQKRTLERWKREGKIPPPDIEGGGRGNADMWKWSVLKPALERAAKLSSPLPDRFPADT